MVLSQCIASYPASIFMPWSWYTGGDGRSDAWLSALSCHLLHLDLPYDSQAVAEPSSPYQLVTFLYTCSLTVWML